MAIDGEPVPGTFAAEDELFGIGRVLGELGTGVFELAPAGALGEDLAAPEREMAWMRKLSAAIGRPVTFALTQNDHDPDVVAAHARALRGDAVAEGARGPAAGRGPAGHAAARAADVPPVRVLPGVGRRSASLPLAEQVARDARSRSCGAGCVAEARRRDRADACSSSTRRRRSRSATRPTTSPTPSTSIAGTRRGARAATSTTSTTTCCMEDDGRALVMRPLLNYTDRNLDAVREMLLHPTSAWGSATAARTAARRATRARPRSCSRTGRATATTTGSRSSGSCAR